MRNQRKQFLRITLPSGSEVWTARVNGRSETPALDAANGQQGAAVLVNIIHSTAAFPVELVYATRLAPVGLLGRVHVLLPHPDVIVTRSTWEMFLPPDATYGEPSDDMTLIEGPSIVGRREMNAVGASLEGLPIAVPAEGIRFAFEKLYAGASDGAVSVSIPYVSGWGSSLVSALSILGTLLFWFGALGLAVMAARRYLPATALERLHLDTERFVITRRFLIALVSTFVVGCALLGITVGYLSSSGTAPILISCLIVVGVAGTMARDRIGAIARKLASRKSAPVPVPVPEPEPVPESVPDADGDTPR